MTGPVWRGQAPGQPPAGAGAPEKIASAAREFEALLIGSLLKSMRASGSPGWLGAGEDRSAESLMEIAEEQMAAMLAAQGGLGLARLITQGLAQPAAGGSGGGLSPDANPSSGR